MSTFKQSTIAMVTITVQNVLGPFLGANFFAQTCVDLFQRGAMVFSNVPGYTEVAEPEKNLLLESEDESESDDKKNVNNKSEWKKISKANVSAVTVRNNYAINDYKPLHIFGQEVLSCYPVYNNVIPQVLLISYKDSIHLSMTLDDNKIPDVNSKFIPGFFDEFNDLAEAAYISQLNKGKDGGAVKLLEKYCCDNIPKYQNSKA